MLPLSSMSSQFFAAGFTSRRPRYHKYFTVAGIEYEAIHMYANYGSKELQDGTRTVNSFLLVLNR